MIVVVTGITVVTSSSSRNVVVVVVVVVSLVEFASLSNHRFDIFKTGRRGINIIIDSSSNLLSKKTNEFKNNKETKAKG